MYTISIPTRGRKDNLLGSIFFHTSDGRWVKTLMVRQREGYATRSQLWPSSNKTCQSSHRVCLFDKRFSEFVFNVYFFLNYFPPFIRTWSTLRLLKIKFRRKVKSDWRFEIDHLWIYDWSWGPILSLWAGCRLFRKSLPTSLTHVHSEFRTCSWIGA